MEIILKPDYLFNLCSYISYKDIYSLGGVCQPLRSRIRGTNGHIIWKKICSLRVNIPILWADTTFDIPDYIRHAVMPLEKYANATILNELKRRYVIKRLEMELRNPEALRLCMLMDTENLKSPYGRMTLMGELDLDTKVLQKQLDRSHDEQLKKSQERLRKEEEEERSNDEWAKKFIYKKPEPPAESDDTTKELTEEEKQMRIEDEDRRQRIHDRNNMYKWQNQEHLKDMEYSIIFKTKTGKHFMQWQGEGGFMTSNKFYVLNRRRKLGLDVNAAPRFPFIESTNKNQTVGRTDDYELINNLCKPVRSEARLLLDEPNREQRLRASMAEVSHIIGMLRSVEARVAVSFFTSWEVKVNLVSWFDELSKDIENYVKPSFPEIIFPIKL